MDKNRIFQLVFATVFTVIVNPCFAQNAAGLNEKNDQGTDSVDNKNISTFSLTQSDLTQQNVLFTPKAPTVAGLIQHIDCPVSYYTGTPEINIPLCKIPLRGMELPISLNYHASGIKVSQEASWVGLGWTLNCAGVVSRTVRCGDDFHEYGSGLDNGIEQGYYFAPEAKYPIDKSYFKSNSLGGNWLLVKDSEPDIFFYSIPNSSGKFLIDKQRGPILLAGTGTDNVKIQLIGKVSGNCGDFYFEIIDTFGNQYFFEKKETTHSFSRRNELNMNYTMSNRVCDEFEQRVRDLYEPSFDFTSSWLLTKIVTNKYQTITFEYKEESYQLPTQESVVKYNWLGGSGTGGSAIASTPQYSCSKVAIDGFRLCRITWDAGSVDFNASEREDIKTWTSGKPSMKLDNIVLKDKEENVVKQYAFTYEYMNGSVGGTYAHVYKRLMLKNIVDASDANFNYSMSYYSGELPPKNSNDIDSWGYSNGIRQGANYYFPASYGGNLYAGGDKTPNLLKMRVGTLQKLTYPTGEESVFNYEIITSTTPPTAVSKQINGSLGACYAYKADDEDVINMPKTNSITLKLESQTIVSIHGYAENLMPNSSDLSYLYDNEEYPVFRVYRINKDGTKNSNWFYSLTAPKEMITLGEQYQYPEYNLGLPAGTYSFEVYAPIKDGYFAIYYSYVGTELAAATERPIGGMRIKEIRGSNVRTFDYGACNLLTPQNTSYVYNFQYFEDNSFNYSQDYLVQNSQPISPMSTLKDGYVYGYNSVKETQGNTSVVYEFFNEPEEQQDEQYPFMPTYLNSYNGLLAKKSTYEWNKLKQVEEYEYSPSESKCVYGFMFKPYESNLHTYEYNIECPQLTRRQTTNKFQNGEMSEEVFLSYNAKKQLAEEKMVTSQATYTSKYLYPTDKQDAVSLNMANNHIFSMPLETQNYLGTKLIGAKRIDYALSGNLFVPTSESIANISLSTNSTNLSQAYTIRKSFAHYSSKGNPREMVTDGQSTILLWSYVGTYPIVQIKNCTYNQLVSYLSETMINSIEDKYQPSSSDWAVLNGLREKLKDAEIITMEYKPFVGITKLTDAKEQSTYYSYDSQGRLSEEYFYENGRKMLLKRYSYHYSNQ